MKWCLAMVGAAVFLAGCGSTSGSTSTAAATNATGPHLGDRCRAKTSIDSTVEVQTVRGPLRCSEAISILNAYYTSAPQAGSGSGAALHIASWFCISEPPAK